jgi:hypothetical protein
LHELSRLSSRRAINRNLPAAQEEMLPTQPAPIRLE